MGAMESQGQTAIKSSGDGDLTSWFANMNFNKKK